MLPFSSTENLGHLIFSSSCPAYVCGVKYGTAYRRLFNVPWERMRRTAQTKLSRLCLPVGFSPKAREFIVQGVLSVPKALL